MSLIWKNISLKGDKVIWFIVFSLSLFSIMVVYSAAGWTDLINHLIRIFIGLFCMYIVHLIPFKYFSKLGQIGYFTSLLLLLLVFLVGVSINGASRWIEIAGLQFQPSDIAKIAVIIYLSRQISLNRNKIKKFKDFFWNILLPLLVVCALILPNNFSTSALVFLNGIILMFIAKIRFRFILQVLSTAIFFGLLIVLPTFLTPFINDIIPRSQTWVSRTNTYSNINHDLSILDKKHQQKQALVAIQNGGIYGSGPGKSSQRSILPLPASDFIFAIILEEYGLIGGVFALLLYLILLFRAIRISLKIDSVFGSLVSVGLIFSLVFQALIHMLVSIGLMPVTGQTLPLISMGGTSLVFTFIAIGIVLSVSRKSLHGKYEKI
mgnify:FL=1|tara:strand:- start:492 stop:1625 length:1134 start_codon:yes stop_codon:yes gene_type:complete